MHPSQIMLVYGDNQCYLQPNEIRLVDVDKFVIYVSLRNSITTAIAFHILPRTGERTECVLPFRPAAAAGSQENALKRRLEDAPTKPAKRGRQEGGVAIAVERTTSVPPIEAKQGGGSRCSSENNSSSLPPLSETHFTRMAMDTSAATP
jgi:hypothetical protein